MARQPTGRIPKALVTKDVAALVDLRGELFDKQQLKRKRDLTGHGQQNTQQQLYVKSSNKNPLQLAKGEAKHLNEETRLRNIRLRELEAKIRDEEEQQRIKCKKALEDKAKRYDTMTAGVFPSTREGKNEDDECMVDFSRKKKREEDDEEDEQMVEYTDEFGRSRHCHRDELELNRAKSELQSRRLNKTMTMTIDHDDDEKMSNETSTIIPPPLTVHHVAVEDNRVYGVSHVPFSSDETKRQEQMTALVGMSAQTELDREKSRKLKEKREAANRTRLNKVLARKGQPILEPDAEPEVIDQIPLPQKVEVIASRKTMTKTIREWDRGKMMIDESLPSSTSKMTMGHSLPTSTSYVERQRAERDNQFAPPSSYFRR